MNALADQGEPACLSQHPAFARWFTKEAIQERVRAKSITGPCADCGKRALILPDPFHETDRPLCADHWLDRRRAGIEMLAKRCNLPASSLTFNALFLVSARKYLLKNRTTYKASQKGET